MADIVCMVNNVPADDLTAKADWASAGMILTKFKIIIFWYLH